MMTHHAVLYRVQNPEQFDLRGVFVESELILHQYQSMGIDEVRHLLVEAYRRPAGEFAVQIIAVKANFITEEAQHALLKVVEEPPTSTRFIFVLPVDLPLLPTLLSRLQQAEVHESAPEHDLFSCFLNNNLNKRMKLIEKNGWDSNWITEIKNGLIFYTGENRHRLSSSQLISLEYVARHLLTRGASNKFLLEHAALVLPT
jgi:DNA polymerase III delta prime subunit